MIILVAPIKEFDPLLVDNEIFIPIVLCDHISSCDTESVDTKRFTFLEESRVRVVYT